MAEPVGRPTDYTPEIHEKVIKLMRKGASIEEVAYRLCVTKQTIYRWKEKYPEFCNAITAGRDFSEGWWMIKGRKNLHCKDFNTALYQINMRNRFGWDKNEHKFDVTVKEEVKDTQNIRKQYEKEI